MSTASEILAQLQTGNWYTIGALRIILKRDKRNVSRMIDDLVGVTLKQTPYGNGYAYALQETADDANIITVVMRPTIATVTRGDKKIAKNPK